MATRKCSDCKKYVYDRDGKIVQRRGGGNQLRGNAPTPCRTCPKKSPTLARQYELSSRNQRLYVVYKTLRATHGRYLTDAQIRDPLLAECLAIIEDIEDSRERGSRLETMMMALTTIKNG